MTFARACSVGDVEPAGALPGLPKPYLARIS